MDIKKNFYSEWSGTGSLEMLVVSPSMEVFKEHRTVALSSVVIRHGGWVGIGLDPLRCLLQS